MISELWKTKLQDSFQLGFRLPEPLQQGLRQGQPLDLRAILAQPKAEVVIHLGDGEEELLRAKRAFPEKMFLAVRGNCDFGSDLPLTGEFTAQGVKIFYTHGHYSGVKSGLYTFACAARERGAQVALYGHTHNALEDYDDGLYLLNPGSLNSWEATYGTVDITPQGIVTNIVKLP